MDEKDEDVGSLVDDVGDEMDGESDVDFDVEDREQDELDLSQNSSDDDDSEIRSNPSDESSAETEFAWSDQLQNVEVELFTARTGPYLGDLELDYTSETYEFLKLHFPDNLIATIKEQTNLYAQQKEAPRSFKPVTDEDINLFLYVNMMFGVHLMPDLVMYWSKDPLQRVSAVADVLSRDRFWQISCYFHVADSEQYIPQ